MTITLRLKEAEKRLLDRAGKHFRRGSRSALVREAVVNYWENKLLREECSPYEAIKEKIGCYRGGPSDLSERVHQYLTKAFHARRARSH